MYQVSHSRTRILSSDHQCDLCIVLSELDLTAGPKFLSLTRTDWSFAQHLHVHWFPDSVPSLHLPSPHRAAFRRCCLPLKACADDCLQLFLTNSCRLSRLSSTVFVANALSIRLYPFQDCLCGRSLSFVPILGGKKGGQSSLDKCKKQKVVPVWTPISTESEHILKARKGGSTDSIMDTVSCENSAPDESTSGLAVTLTSGAEYYKSEPEPLEGNETTPVSCKTENISENRGNTTLIDSNIVIQQVEVIRETLTVSKPNKDSEIVNKAEKHSASIQVDAPLIRFIKGKWGLTQKQIEGETGVKIIFPSAKGDSSIVIEGASVENVTRASEKITNVLEQAVKSPNLDYSHFVSLPLAIHPELVEKLHSFQKSVLEEVNMIPEGDMDGSSSDDSADEKALGIDRSIFIKPQTFHLTVLMLKLWNKDRIVLATEILKGVSSKVMDALENRPVSIRLRGLACMKGSPAKAHVVYAPIEEVSGDGRLLRACQVIIDAFVEAGLVLQKDAHQSLKLHATLMNARHRKRKMWTRRHDSFDARGIFKRYGSEDWGEYVIPEAHLSQRFLFDESGYYHCCGSIAFPGI